MSISYWLGFGPKKDGHTQLTKLVQDISPNLDGMSRKTAAARSNDLYILFRDNLKAEIPEDLLNKEIDLILSNCICKNPEFDSQFKNKFVGFESHLKTGNWHPQAGNLVCKLVEAISHKTQPHFDS